MIENKKYIEQYTFARYHFRVFSWLLDTIIFLFLLISLNQFFNLVSNFFNIYPILLPIFQVIFSISLWFLYFIYLDKYSRTPGKAIFNLKLINLEDYGKNIAEINEVDYEKIIVRNIFTVILMFFIQSLIGLMYLSFASFSNTRSKLFNDNLSKSILIKLKVKNGVINND